MAEPVSTGGRDGSDVTRSVSIRNDANNLKSSPTRDEAVAGAVMPETAELSTDLPAVVVETVPNDLNHGDPALGTSGPLSGMPNEGEKIAASDSKQGAPIPGTSEPSNDASIKGEESTANNHEYGTRILAKSEPSNDSSIEGEKTAADNPEHGAPISGTSEPSNDSSMEGEESTANNHEYGTRILGTSKPSNESSIEGEKTAADNPEHGQHSGDQHSESPGKAVGTHSGVTAGGALGRARGCIKREPNHPGAEGHHSEDQHEIQRKADGDGLYSAVTIKGAWGEGRGRGQKVKTLPAPKGSHKGDQHGVFTAKSASSDRGFAAGQQRMEGPHYGVPPKHWKEAKEYYLRVAPSDKCKHGLQSLNDIAAFDFPDASGIEKELQSKLSVWKGDITKLAVDAIVNAANSRLLGGGGVDGAIHMAAGELLKDECRTLHGCSTGDAKITGGFKLPAKYVIHTVGPMDGDPRMLRRCYQKCLSLVSEHKLKSVAFPCIATGIYGFPNDSAAEIAVATTREWLLRNDNYKQVERVIFCVFLPLDSRIYAEVLSDFPAATHTPPVCNNDDNDGDDDDNIGGDYC